MAQTVTVLPLSYENWKKYKEITEDGIKCPRLSDWEKEFIGNLFSKLEVFEEGMRLSSRQIAVLERIAREKIYVY